MTPNYMHVDGRSANGETFSTWVGIASCGPQAASVHRMWPRCISETTLQYRRQHIYEYDNSPNPWVSIYPPHHAGVTRDCVEIRCKSGSNNPEVCFAFTHQECYPRTTYARSKLRQQPLFQPLKKRHKHLSSTRCTNEFQSNSGG